MSKIKLEPNASGTGTLTISAPNTNTDRTISLTDTTGNIVTTGDSGTVTAPMLDGGQTGSAPAFGVRAFVMFNGTEAFQGAVKVSGNVSSVTDNATGDYTINFTTDMPSANYATVFGTENFSTSSTRVPQAGIKFDTALTASAVNVVIKYSNTTATFLDWDHVGVAIIC